MAAQPQMSQAAAQAGLDAILAKLNVNPPGKIRILTGAPPANLEAAETGTLLAVLTFSNPAFPASVAITSPRGAKATANTITADTNADATGTAGYFRAVDGNGLAVLQGTCGTSDADMILNTTSIVAGATVSISSYEVILPNGG